jgi:uncharacterized 2Fe-2S/4Fe-4S cluster protein (DUF4445 family)
MIIVFQPTGKTQQATAGETLSEVASKAAVTINADCAGQGTCGKCKIKVLSGDTGLQDDTEKKLLSKEELEAGIRLACRVKVQNDMTVQVLSATGHMGRKKDMARLPEGFVPDLIKGGQGEPKEYYGLAFDIGTTTVVGMLWDLRNADPVGAVARTNPQSTYGADVISRIMFCGREEGNLGKMQQLITDCFNDIVREFEEEYAIDPKTIKKVTAVGNTTMSHLLLGVDPQSLALAPFSPGFTGPVTKKAKELNLIIDENAQVNVLPNIAGHVGSDIVAVLLSSGLSSMEGANLAIDIGTNGEIVLANSGKVLACSTAAFLKQVSKHQHTYQRRRIRQNQGNHCGYHDGEDYLLTLAHRPQLLHLYFTLFLRRQKSHYGWLNHRYQGHVGIGRYRNGTQKMGSQFGSQENGRRPVCSADDSDRCSFLGVKARQQHSSEEAGEYAKLGPCSH